MVWVQCRRNIVEISAAKSWDSEKLVESPKGDEQDEEETDGPKRVEALQMVGRAGFESEEEDEAEGQNTDHEEDGDEG